MSSRSWLGLRVIRILFLVLDTAVSYRIHYGCSHFYGEPLLRRRRSRLHQRKADRLCRTAIDLKGILIKLGQFLSARVDLLPDEYTRTLARLQDSVPPDDFASIRQRLRDELGKNPDEVFAAFNETPIAAASLGQVHEAVLKDGRRVAVKVQYPGIRRIVEADLRAARWASWFLQRFLHRIRLDILYEEFSRILHQEMDYIQEARNAERFHRNFDGDDRIVVPNVIWDYTTPHVLTLEFVEGIKITEFETIRAAGVELPALARLLMESYMIQLFAHRFLHGDPHPGNLFVRPGRTPGGGPVLVFVDFGLMQPLSPAMREGIKTTVGGIIDRDISRIVQGLFDLGFIDRTGDRRAIEQVATFFIEKYRDISPKAFREIGVGDIAHDLEQIFSVSSAVQIPNNFILIWRTLGMLNGINSKLDPNLNIIELAKPYAVSFIRAEESWLDRLWKTGREVGGSLVSLPKALETFLVMANRGEFKTRMSSDDVTGALLKLHRLVFRAILGALLLALLVVSRFFDYQEQPLESRMVLAAAIVTGMALGWSFLKARR
ncbi:MAG: AarF/ABC1/UbiB kinase family protein [Nitrospirae bacterium]|nr:AarF/ABC1/UbiB kinase family protein [Nitrospirota bacterium]